ncbi:RING-type E3 ubiquitin transferase [Melia azedarach]|uniref:RING-type E3 ubiquitin transferase n=1 Tax=Melia azedarach TaxID=155640 RepID=A0ACC1XAF5_MELAZ|nr:RING-type E3 ubiquitin transferase [Melia azedarach]
MAAISAATTASEILHQTNTFISEILAQPDLRHSIYSTLRNKIPPSNNQTRLKPLNLAAETLENAISSTTNSSIQSSSLRLAKKLLLSYPQNPFSSFLFSLIYHLCNQPVNASLSLLNIFSLDPSLARSEIAPVLFEELFLVHFVPILQRHNEQRSSILSSLSTQSGYDSDEYSVCDVSVVVPCTKLLSKMSGNQASELKELERNYEEVLDENCRIIENETIKSEEGGWQNGRYNPIWVDREKSGDFFSGSNKFKYPFYPQRVSLSNPSNQNAEELNTTPGVNSDSDIESSLDENSANYSSSDSEVEEAEQKNIKMTLSEPRQSQNQKEKQPIFAESSRSPSPDNLMGDAGNPPGGGKPTPPKDFVCPITTHIFDDPVTLETGQTYERTAIQEWIERGNSTCPITRQKLHSTQLPKTNYVLKRLIASWREQYPGSAVSQSENPRLDSETMSKSIVPSTSPNSVISQATIDGTITELRHAITNLCTSEILRESEMAVLQIERFWQEANMELDIQIMLSKPPVINGFVEILFNSVDSRVLEATVFLLSELGSRDKSVIQTLTRVESDVDCIVALFKKGLLEAVVLLYLLRPSTMTLIELDMMKSLLIVIKKKEEDFRKMCLKPKSASMLLLGQIVRNSKESIVSSIASTIVSSRVFESIISSLKADWAEERIAAVGILLRCMQEDGKCRNTIADKAELAPVLESFMAANDGERFEIACFFSELVKLKRRASNEQILHIIKDEGTYSTMHTLLVYLQTASQDKCPVVAGLLLQLDLLAEPRKMSIYREEAIDALISCLRNSEFLAAQIAAAETIMSLQGEFTASGKPLSRAILLKRAGLGQSYKNLKRTEQLSNISREVEDTSEEEKAADDWERKMAFVLVSHEFGLLFEALAEGLKSKNAQLYSACFGSATWLIYMLKFIPDTGILGAARVCLLKRFISIFKSVKDTDDRALSLLALNSFLQDPEGLRDLSPHMKDLMKGLREFRKSSPLAFEMLKVLCEEHESSADFWNHKELIQVDSSENGEVLSIACFRDKIFSGHSDGTIKVWTGRGSILHLIQEIQEHSKAVTGLAILQSGESLYSGSLDKTARVWSIGNETIHCVQVHDIKDQIQNLVVTNSMLCFIPQGAGIKVHSWNGRTRLLNSSKYPKCLTLVQGRLFCGCQDSSIQEIDVATGTFATIQSGHRKLLGKANPIHALQVAQRTDILGKLRPGWPSGEDLE